MLRGLILTRLRRIPFLHNGNVRGGDVEQRRETWRSRRVKLGQVRRDLPGPCQRGSQSWPHALHRSASCCSGPSKHASRAEPASMPFIVSTTNEYVSSSPSTSSA